MQYQIKQGSEHQSLLTAQKEATLISVTFLKEAQSAACEIAPKRVRPNCEFIVNTGER